MRLPGQFCGGNSGLGPGRLTARAGQHGSNSSQASNYTQRQQQQGLHQALIGNPGYGQRGVLVQAAAPASPSAGAPQQRTATNKKPAQQRSIRRRAVANAAAGQQDGTTPQVPTANAAALNMLAGTEGHSATVAQGAAAMPTSLHLGPSATATVTPSSSQTSLPHLEPVPADHATSGSAMQAHARASHGSMSPAPRPPHMDSSAPSGGTSSPGTSPSPSHGAAGGGGGSGSSSGGVNHHHHAHSQAAHQLLDGVPDELKGLLDPEAPVTLPSPGSLGPAALDNARLDRLLAALGRGRATWRRALVLYQWLKASGHHLDDRLCTTLIRVCADHGDAVSALGVYEWMRAPPAAGGAGLSPTAYTFTAAMRAALCGGMLDKAMQVWDDCKAAGLLPDCRLCITYMEVCTRLGLTDKALAMYCQMRDAPPGSPMRPSVHAYTAAMRAATDGGRWMRALGVWDDMRRSGTQPTGHAYAAAISACAAGQDWARAVALFDDMTSRAGIRPDVVSCTALVTALASAGEADKAEAVVAWMQRAGLKPNVRTYTALLTALGNAAQWARAVGLLFAMQRPENGGVQPNAFSYSALIKALGEHGQWQLAEAVFEDLEVQVRARRASELAPSGSGSNSGVGSKVEEPARAAAAARLLALAAAADSSQQASPVPGMGLIAGLVPALSGGAAGLPAPATVLQLMQLVDNNSSTAPQPPTSFPSAASNATMPPNASLWPNASSTMPPSAAPPTTTAPSHPLSFNGANSNSSKEQSFSSPSRSPPPVPDNDTSPLATAATGSTASSAQWSHPSQLYGIQLDLRSGGDGDGDSSATSNAPGEQLIYGVDAAVTTTTTAAPVPSSLREASVALHQQQQQQRLAAEFGAGGGNVGGVSAWAAAAVGGSQSPPAAGTYAYLSNISPASPNQAQQMPPGGAYGGDGAGSWQLPSGGGAGLPITPLQGFANNDDTDGGFSLFSSPPHAVAASSGNGAAPASPALAAGGSGGGSHHQSPNERMTAGGASSSNSGGGGSGGSGSGGASINNNNSSSGSAATPLVNEVVCGAMMLAYERAGRWGDAVHVLRRARDLGVAPNVAMLNVAISAAGKAGQVELAEGLFSAARAARDVATHEALIMAYAVSGLAEQAERAFVGMMRDGLRPREYAYCSLIAAHSLSAPSASGATSASGIAAAGGSGGGGVDAALGVRGRMARDGVAPGVHTYNALLAACDRAGRYEQALMLLQAMKREGIEPNLVTHRLMAAVGQHGVQTVESQQVAAAALSAVFAAAGGLLIRAGMF